MTIIIKHLDTGNEYILLGIGLGEAKSSLPSRVLSDLFQGDNPDKAMMVTACDVQGQIVALNSNSIIVVEIDGKQPSEILPEILPTSAQPLLHNPKIEDEQELDEELDEDEDDEDEDWI